jgi:3-oxoadipate enol-lactonase
VTNRVFVEVGDGCRIASWIDGPHGAPVLVLSNALGTTAAMWAPQLDALTARFRVLRYDSRGHGASAAPPGPYSIERLGRDILDVIDAYGFGRVHFCGLSKGGMVGQWLGAHAPDRIDCLVLANTAAYMGPAFIWQQRLDVVLREGMAAIADAVLGRWFTSQFCDRAPHVVAGLRAMLLSTPPVGYAGCCAAIRDMDLRENTSSIVGHTLLITGAVDPSTPPIMTEEIAQAMSPPPQIVTLEAAHLSNVEQPDGFTRALLAFLP